MAKKVINAFNGGEVSPDVHARTDSSVYDKSCFKMENFIPLKQGGVSKRPASKFFKSTESNNKARIEPFIRSVSENYLLEFTNLKLRVIKTDGTVLYTFTTLYTEAKLFDFKYVQKGNDFIIAHPDFPVTLLKRTAENTFTFGNFVFEYPPFEDLNTNKNSEMINNHDTGFMKINSSNGEFKTTHVNSKLKIVTKIPPEELSVNKRFDGISGVTDAINCSSNTFFVETTGRWSGKVIVQRSLDNGATFENFFVLGDTSTVVSTTDIQNFTFSSTEPEDVNTFIRVRYIDGTLNSDGCHITLKVNKTEIDNIVTVNSRTSANEAECFTDAKFPDSVTQYKDWTQYNSSATNFIKGDKFFVLNQVNATANTFTLSTTSADYQKSIATGGSDDESDIANLVRFDYSRQENLLYGISKSGKIHRFLFDPNASYEFTYHGLFANILTDPNPDLTFGGVPKYSAESNPSQSGGGNSVIAQSGYEFANANKILGMVSYRPNISGQSDLENLIILYAKNDTEAYPILNSDTSNEGGKWTLEQNAFGGRVGWVAYQVQAGGNIGTPLGTGEFGADLNDFVATTSFGGSAGIHCCIGKGRTTLTSLDNGINYHDRELFLGLTVTACVQNEFEYTVVEPIPSFTGF